MAQGARIEPGSVIRISQDQISADIGDEAVLLQLQRGRYYGLNQIGAQVWKVLQEGPTTVAALQNNIVENYEVEPGECARDLEALLLKMAEAGLVEIA